MMLERCGCTLRVGVVLIGDLVWVASRVGDILEGATEVGVSLSFVTDC